MKTYKFFACALAVAAVFTGCNKGDEPDNPEGVQPTAITLSQAELTVEEGQTANLAVAFTPSDATGTLVWTSSDEAVATVTQEGIVTGVAEGTAFSSPTIEFSYKNDDLGDPLINDYHALALNLATKDEIETIKNMAFAVNDAMKEFFKHLNIDLIDFKLEFGRFHGSPDTCRFWEAGTWDTTKHTSLDKDRFRRDLGGVEDAYQEVFKRLTGE